MQNPLRGSIAAVLAAAVGLSPLAASAVQAAGSRQPQVETAGTLDLSARKRHYRRGNSRAAMQMFGMVLGTIGTIAAAEEARRYRHRYYGHYGYGYAPPPPYYYGYGPYYRY